MLSDKMEFSITLWNIWSVLPFPGKTTTRVCSVGKHFTLSFPRVAGRNRCQELQTRKRRRPPQRPQGRCAGGSLPRSTTRFSSSCKSGLPPVLPSSHGCTRIWRKSTPSCGEIGQDTKGTPGFTPVLQQTSPAIPKHRWDPRAAENTPLSNKSVWKFSWGRR